MGTFLAAGVFFFFLKGVAVFVFFLVLLKVLVEITAKGVRFFFFQCCILLLLLSGR